MSQEFVVIGDGIAGATAAETLREESGAEITVLTDEEEPLYNRITLKSYMKDRIPKRAARIHDEEWYESHDIKLELGTRAKNVKREEKLVETGSGKTYSYDKLLVATGGSAKKFPADEGYENVYYMWTMRDAEEIKRNAEEADKAVVIGAGFLGIDLAVIYAEHGAEVDYIMRGDRWWRKGLDETGAKIIHRKLEEKGVNLVKNTEIERFEAQDGNVKAAVSGDGERFECDSVGVAIGQEPNSGFVEVEKNDEGMIKTDKYLQTSDKDIYAAGNMIEFYHPIYERRVEKGSWDNSEEMGKIAAKNMLAKKEQQEEYDYINTYGVGHFDVPFLAIGDWNGKPFSKKYGEDEYRRFFFQDDQLVGAVLIGETKGQEEFKRMILEKKVTENYQALTKIE